MARSLLSLWRSGRRLLRLQTQLATMPHVVEAPPPVRVSAPDLGEMPNPGALEERLYRPEGLRPGAPVVVLLHGCGQEPEALAEAAGWMALAEQSGFLLLMPRQSADNNSQRCFNWYQPEDIGRDLGEAASIHAMAMRALARHQGDPARVFVTGLSAGAAMAACVLASYPESFAAGATVAGLPAGCASGVVGAMTRMAGHGRDLSQAELTTRARALAPKGWQGRWPRLQIWHGMADGVVAPGNGLELAAQWCGLHLLHGQGVAAAPQFGLHRRSWSGADGGVAVEQVTVDGLGHAMPADRLFSPLSVIAPCKVWAAAEIVRFWGMSGEAVTDRAPTRM